MHYEQIKNFRQTFTKNVHQFSTNLRRRSDLAIRSKFNVTFDHSQTFRRHWSTYLVNFRPICDVAATSEFRQKWL